MELWYTLNWYKCSLWNMNGNLDDEKNQAHNTCIRSLCIIKEYWNAVLYIYIYIYIYIYYIDYLNTALTEWMKYTGLHRNPPSINILWKSIYRYNVDKCTKLELEWGFPTTAITVSLVRVRSLCRLVVKNIKSCRQFKYRYKLTRLQNLSLLFVMPCIVVLNLYRFLKYM